MNPHNTISEQPDRAYAAGDDRWQRTAVAAFFMAEARGFAPGHELDDWLAAERQIETTGVPSAVGSGDATVAIAAPALPEAPAAPVKRARTSARKAAAAAPDSTKAATPRKAATTKRSVRTRKTPPGSDSELGGAA